MSTINVKIRSNIHPIACDPAQIESAKVLAQNLTDSIGELADNFNKATDTQLLIMAALKMAEEVEHSRQNISSSGKSENEADLAVAQTLNAIAEYIETLVSKLEK